MANTLSGFGILAVIGRDVQEPPGWTANVWQLPWQPICPKWVMRIPPALLRHPVEQTPTAIPGFYPKIIWALDLNDLMYLWLTYIKPRPQKRDKGDGISESWFSKCGLWSTRSRPSSRCLLKMRTPSRSYWSIVSMSSACTLQVYI